jgi:ABC-2 type transport system ATP-binding protein
MQPVIQVQQLSKHFKVFKHHQGSVGAIRNLFTRTYHTVKAVDEISFRINPGEMIGYIGPNGAGKSTTIKMLTGLLVPTSGSLLVNGRIPWRERQQYVSRIGAVFGQRTTLWWDLPVIESLSLLKYIYKIPENRFNENLTEFRALLDLDTFLDTPVRALSLGQRMRADICAALLHDPDLLFLDEPTIGLDVVVKERIRNFIKHINQERKTTILLTTHDLQDVEKLCERVLIIDGGKLLFDGHLDTLKDRFGGNRKLLVEFTEPYISYAIDGAEIIQQDNRRVVYSFIRKDITASELIGRLSRQYHIHDISVREPEVETTIRKIYEEQLLKNKPEGL